jgi:hypothetical protein
MNTNPILEETWKVKDQLARQAEGDLTRLCEQTRDWLTTHPHKGAVIRSSEDLRRLIADHPTTLVAENPPTP